MPALQRREVIQLSLLVMVVPLQFWLSHEFKHSSSNPVLKITMNVIDALHGSFKLCTIKLWETIQKIMHSTGLYSDEDDPSDESPAKEVFEFRKIQDSLFASSTVPRYSRPLAVRFRIGDVVLNKEKNIRGVVVGWDYTAQAPPKYLKEFYTINEVNQPNYLIAIDTRDRLNAQFTYTADEYLQLLENVRIFHPNIEEYFEYYDGLRYVPRPWLQSIYPKD